MLKVILFLFILLNFLHCSFDNKTGIWQNNETLTKKTSNQNKDLIDIFQENKTYQNEKLNVRNKKIILDKNLINKNWKSEFFNLNNNISNINYKNNKILISNKPKVPRSKSFEYANRSLLSPLIYNGNIIFSNNKGTIFVYSLTTKKKIFQFNFYKKRFKKFRKEVYLAINNGIIFAADNLGYSYALKIENQKVIWAKNFGVPFRSNIKIAFGSMFLSNQENELFSININTGDKNWQFSTTPQLLKSKFINNILIDERTKSIFFLNNNGELYSINYSNQTINWFKSFNKFSSPDSNELFNATPITLNSKNLVVQAGNSITNINALNGSVLWKKNISSKVKPVISTNNVFVISENNFLICIENTTGEIIWSKKISKETSKKSEKFSDKYFDTIKVLAIVDSQIFLFSKDGYLLSFNATSGNLISLDRIIKSKLGSRPIFSNGYMYLFDKKIRLLQFE